MSDVHLWYAVVTGYVPEIDHSFTLYTLVVQNYLVTMLIEGYGYQKAHHAGD